MKRLLPANVIPQSLWDSAKGALRLPTDLSRAYSTLIDRHGLRQLAATREDSDSPVGGLTQEKTDEHFARAFSGSVARAQLAVLDPYEHVVEASNAFIRSLAGGHLALTDAPCGAGAAALSFLCTIAALRQENVLPRQPLNVHLIGAELSKPAQQYAAAMLEEIKPTLEQQAIFVESEFVDWDVTDQISNTELIKKMTIAGAASSHRLLIVANFNGFLEREHKKKQSERQLEELFRHASTPKTDSVAVWIEPKTSSATKGLFRWLANCIDKWKRFVRASDSGEPPTSEANFFSPLFEGHLPTVRLAVMALKLQRNS